MNIQTERLRLRNFSLEDTGQAAFYLQDPQVMQYVEPPFGEEQIQRFILLLRPFAAPASLCAGRKTKRPSDGTCDFPSL